MTRDMPAERARFLCLSCGEIRSMADAALDDRGFLICDSCWALDPPQVDVDGVFQEVADRWRAMARAEAAMVESVCEACGGRSCNGTCGRGCRL